MTSKQVIVWGAALLIGFAAQGCGQQSAADQAYGEAARCFKAASAYGQILGLLGKSEEQKSKMIDYGLDLRDRALREGAKIKKTETDLMMESDYLNRFFALDEEHQKAELTDFGKAEVEHCKLEAVIAPSASP